MERKPDALLEAMVASGSLARPGAYGLSDDDPNVQLIRDLGRVANELEIRPVIIGGIAVIVNGYARTTLDVDLLVARDEALKLVRKLETTAGFRRIRIDRFSHGPTARTVDLCVQGELTSPRHKDRFPSPAEVEQIPRKPLPVVGLVDLLALKAKSARARDEADFVQLFQERHLTAKHAQAVRAKVQDRALKQNVDRWHARAVAEIEREKLRRPPKLR